MVDAFEVRKMRNPIPVESWGQRPPSRAGQKVAPLDTTPEEPKMLLVQSRSMSSSVGASPSKTVGGTWASARSEPRVMSETRRGRERKKRQSPGPGYASPDLGICACGSAPPGPRMSKNLSGVFDHGVQLGSRGSPWGQLHPGTAVPWDRDNGLRLEISGYGLGDSSGSSYPGSPDSCGSPPTRQRARQTSDGVSVEDVDGDVEFRPHTFLRDATPPTVIVTRASGSRSRKDLRRGSEQRPREREQRNTFNTSLDMDFLSLFAS